MNDNQIDWSKAGRRIRWQQRKPGATHNPDWNTTAQRWKDEADYYAEECHPDMVIHMVECPDCLAPKNEPCEGVGMAPFHMRRRRAAGEFLLASHGGRFRSA